VILYCATKILPTATPVAFPSFPSEITITENGRRCHALAEKCRPSQVLNCRRLPYACDVPIAGAYPSGLWAQAVVCLVPESSPPHHSASVQSIIDTTGLLRSRAHISRVSAAQHTLVRSPRDHGRVSLLRRTE
jgi:hypothetical protein